jgi:hypothetical protein
VDKNLWKIDKYRGFLEARKLLLATEMNQRLEELLHGDTHWLDSFAATVTTMATVIGGITSEAEEEDLEVLNNWVIGKGLPGGEIAYDFADPDTREQKAVFDLAWPSGIQEGLSQPVAVLLNETTAVMAIASQAGFRCFTSVPDFKQYVEREILGVVVA